jgi:hypothetical protein
MDTDYYRQNGAPPSKGIVHGAKKADRGCPLGDNEEEVPLKCYKLDADTDIVDDKVYINGEGKPQTQSAMLDMQNLVDGLDPEELNPGIRPGDVEVVVSYILAVVVSLVIGATALYYLLLAYKEHKGQGESVFGFIRRWALRWPFC